MNPSDSPVLAKTGATPVIQSDLLGEETPVKPPSMDPSGKKAVPADDSLNLPSPDPADDENKAAFMGERNKPKDGQ